MANKFHYGNGYNSENSIAIIWGIEDVQSQLEYVNEHYNINLILHDDDCMEVLRFVEDNHDAEEGITWGSITYGIEHCFQEEINELKQNTLFQGDKDITEEQKEILTELFKPRI